MGSAASVDAGDPSAESDSRLSVCVRNVGALSLKGNLRCEVCPGQRVSRDFKAALALFSIEGDFITKVAIRILRRGGLGGLPI